MPMPRWMSYLFCCVKKPKEDPEEGCLSYSKYIGMMERINAEEKLKEAREEMLRAQERARELMEKELRRDKRRRRRARALAARQRAAGAEAEAEAEAPHPEAERQRPPPPPQPPRRPHSASCTGSPRATGSAGAAGSQAHGPPAERHSTLATSSTDAEELSEYLTPTMHSMWSISLQTITSASSYETTADETCGTAYHYPYIHENNISTPESCKDTENAYCRESVCEPEVYEDPAGTCDTHRRRAVQATATWTVGMSQETEGPASFRRPSPPERLVEGGSGLPLSSGYGTRSPP